jgi:hypothetical protein
MAAIADIRLAQMPAGAENKIGKALGIRRAAVVIMEVKQDEEVLFRLGEMPTVNAPWLQGALALEPVYADVASKTLQTTAPMMSKKRKVDDEQSISNKKPCIEK